MVKLLSYDNNFCGLDIYWVKKMCSGWLLIGLRGICVDSFWLFSQK